MMQACVERLVRVFHALGANILDKLLSSRHQRLADIVRQVRLASLVVARGPAKTHQPSESDVRPPNGRDRLPSEVWNWLM